MHRQLGIAAVLAPLLLATPAAAQEAVNYSSDPTASRLGTSYVPSSSQGRDYVAPGGGIFPDQAKGVSASRLPLVKEDGSEVVRNGLVGSWQVASDVNLGLGLFSVRGTSVRERDFKRAQPMRDVGSRDNRVAAVGLSFRF